MTRGKIALALSIAGIVVTTQAVAAVYPVSYVLQNSEQLANKRVTIEGAVSNSTVVTPEPPENLRGEYDLSDQTGTIHVKTRRKPPPNGDWRKVSGVLDASGATPLLIETGGIPLWALITALGVLVIVAVVLVVLIARKPRGTARAEAVRAPSATVPASAPPAPAPATSTAGPPIVCPKCQSANDPDANFCQNCREPLRMRTEAAPPTKAAPTTVAAPQEVKPGEKPTVHIPAAPEERPLGDLTVIEGEGAKYGTRLALRKERQKIGRAENMDIRLADETMSREHASIWWEDGSFYIQDEASTSGTLVNGEKVTRETLADNDVIELGKTKLVFRVIAGPASSE